jgi:hypothetical protein
MPRKKEPGYKNGTPLKEYSIALPFFFVPFHLTTLKALAVYLKTVTVDFFYLQWAVKLGIKKISVIAVDHALDSKVPFCPDRASVYLDFVAFWIRPMSLLIKRLERKKSVFYCAQFLTLITAAYKEAARVYRFKMSTTERPETRDKLMLRIRKVDPHYLCVPSLHIAVVALTFSYFRSVFKNECACFDAEIIIAHNKALYRGAVEIAETVLYVKQHSVNCIPAALYMIHNLAPHLFSVQDAVDFIDSLFGESVDIPQADKSEINRHIHYMFDRLMLEGCYESDWTFPVKRWITRYKGQGSGSAVGLLL